MQYDSGVVDCEQIRLALKGPSNGKSLISVDWMKLNDVGQVYVGGEDELRESLVNFFIEAGFKFVDVKNESTRVTWKCSSEVWICAIGGFIN